jgi:hypothetical protein
MYGRKPSSPKAWSSSRTIRVLPSNSIVAISADLTLMTFVTKSEGLGRWD